MVTILILLETPLQFVFVFSIQLVILVTILILLETPLQSIDQRIDEILEERHNPYFTGNSFAIKKVENYLNLLKRSQSLFYWKLLCNTYNFSN